MNEGMVIENIVAQALRANGHRGYYYKETDKASRKTTMEIDFLIRNDRKVIPIEVKSGKNISAKSLTAFQEKYGKQTGDAIVLHHGGKKEGKWFGCHTIWQHCYDIESSEQLRISDREIWEV